MTSAIPLLCGATAGLGLLIIAAGWHGDLGGGARLRRSGMRRLASMQQVELRLILAVTLALAMAVLTGWVVGVLMAALGGMTLPSLFQARKRRELVVEQTEALATWAEQLRDTIAAAAGLRAAIAATATVAAPSIASSVRELDVRLRSEPFDTAIRRFAERLDDPIADKIAVALLIASERRGQRLTDVLAEIASAAREHAEMDMRMEAARARIYTQALTVTVILLGMFAVMIVVSREYLAAYDSLQGQLVLFVVFIGWSAAFAGLVELSKVRRPPRVIDPMVDALAATTPMQLGEWVSAEDRT